MLENILFVTLCRVRKKKKKCGKTHESYPSLRHTLPLIFNFKLVYWFMPIAAVFPCTKLGLFILHDIQCSGNSE